MIHSTVPVSARHRTGPFAIAYRYDVIRPLISFGMAGSKEGHAPIRPGLVWTFARNDGRIDGTIVDDVRVISELIRQELRIRCRSAHDECPSISDGSLPSLTRILYDWTSSGDFGCACILCNIVDHDSNHDAVNSKQQETCGPQRRVESALLQMLERECLLEPKGLREDPTT